MSEKERVVFVDETASDILEFLTKVHCKCGECLSLTENEAVAQGFRAMDDAALYLLNGLMGAVLEAHPNASIIITHNPQIGEEESGRATDGD